MARKKRKSKIEEPQDEALPVEEEFSESVEEPVYVEPAPVSAPTEGQTFTVNSHLTHAGTEYQAGDPITLEAEHTIAKLKGRGVIS